MTVAVTLDVDWAPDKAIDEAAELLMVAGVKATWYVTHRSPAVDRLREWPDFELGLHPNFLAGSTHGKSIAEVIAHCLDLVPEATSFRAHALATSAPVYREMVARTSIRIDSSVLLARGMCRPFRQRVGDQVFVRVPFVWTDDIELYEPRGMVSPARLLSGDDPAVILFHPTLIALNASQPSDYQTAHGRFPKMEFADLEAQPGYGVGSLFRDTIAALAWRKHECVTVTELASWT